MEIIAEKAAAKMARPAALDTIRSSSCCRVQVTNGDYHGAEKPDQPPPEKRGDEAEAGKKKRSIKRGTCDEDNGGQAIHRKTII